ncbi:hypothetical protein GTA62_10790 [Roseobacter sp. HKCCD9010]|uniref:hypothetical protein n=1 Tax=unclassified Roseobacter TaxID=196798 RepID=UPI001491B249|nr:MULTISPECIES: hypothetical protein [unclassified Roseobacter]MBF9050329.1 hypothetical protein [Rhodobacterales bacterium HKCCD4356]NNV12572.1 hypothetical protein [Roseobacter sp. HKCCD7357]NNV15963.1 hypothetical protein [Roseobacter sp. HKCCD8768]NNV25423.1 hypothetical protein [Roseobacter sp. HKCCD8192]NNV29680.1 hypothetical protein [Roseobacter sp. HKCCD9061]
MTKIKPVGSMMRDTQRAANDADWRAKHRLFDTCHRRPLSQPVVFGACSEWRSTKVDMMMNPMLFICLFFAGFGVFMLGAGFVWWVSLQAKQMEQGKKA